MILRRILLAGGVCLRHTCMPWNIYFRRHISLGPHTIVISYDPDPIIPGALYGQSPTYFLFKKTLSYQTLVLLINCSKLMVGASIENLSAVNETWGFWLPCIDIPSIWQFLHWLLEGEGNWVKFMAVIKKILCFIFTDGTYHWMKYSK